MTFLGFGYLRTVNHSLRAAPPFRRSLSKHNEMVNDVSAPLGTLGMRRANINVSFTYFFFTRATDFVVKEGMTFRSLSLTFNFLFFCILYNTKKLQLKTNLLTSNQFVSLFYSFQT